MSNRLKQLHAAGQAVWLDYLDRKFLAEGGLRKLIEEDGLTGVTSNPSIFEKAMGHGNAYDEGFKAFLVQTKGHASAEELYESQAIRDVQSAADDLRPVYDRLGRRDGYVSIEVSPDLANDTQATIDEARLLWRQVDRPNLMVKVPGTKAGAPAVQRLTEEGLNINITLLFSQSAYHAVAQAFMAGLEARLAAGKPIDGIASVASFFVSRIDSKIDATIDRRIHNGDAQAEGLKAVRGKVAIANAKLAYAWWQDMVAAARWQALADKGAMVQRLLWASTSTKDPAFPDTLYADALIGRDTIDTMPPQTIDAFREHGTVAQALTQDVDGARKVLAEVERLGLDLDAVTAALVDEGVRKFTDAAAKLLASVEQKRVALTR